MPINTCLKYCMTPTKTLPSPPPTYVKYGSLYKCLILTNPSFFHLTKLDPRFTYNDFPRHRVTEII